jgi:hypothetical protein
MTDDRSEVMDREAFRDGEFGARLIADLLDGSARPFTAGSRAHHLQRFAELGA